MKKLQDNFFIFLILLSGWNSAIARSSPKLEVDLSSTDGSLNQVSEKLQTQLANFDLKPGTTQTISITPPYGSKDSFLQLIMQAAQKVVPKIITNAAVSFKISASKSSDDTISNIQLTMIIGEAQTTGDVTNEDSNIPSSNTKNGKIDLSTGRGDPMTSIESIVKQLISSLKPKMDNRESIQVLLNIIPPSGSTETFVGTVMSSLHTLMQQLVPVGMESGVRASMKGQPDGTLIDISLTITVTVSGDQTTSESNGGENLMVDLSSPGINIQQILQEVLTAVVTNPIVMTKNPLTLNLQMKPPAGATKDTIQNIVTILKTVLSDLIPSAELSIKTSMSQTSDGIITTANSVITITKAQTDNPNQINYKFDLTPSGSNLIQEVTKILPNIKDEVTTFITTGEPATLNLVIKPPIGVSDDYVKTSVNEIITTLQKVLPNKIKVTASASKDSRGNINQMILLITVEPDIPSIKIDLTKPGSNNIIQEITTLIPALKEKINEEQIKNKNVKFSIIITPTKTTNVQDIMNNVVTTLSKHIPNNKITVQAKITKDSNGNILKIIIIPTIEPNVNAQQPDDQELINVDLTNPGTTLVQEVTNVLPALEEKVNIQQPNNKITNFIINVTPPRGTHERVIKPTLTEILTILGNKFPNNKIEAKAETTKDTTGISNIYLTFKIHPKDVQDNEEPGLVNIDLTKPNTELIEELTNILPEIKDKVNKEEPKGDKINFNLVIKPPIGSTEIYVKTLLPKVVEYLSKIFPMNKISVKAQTTKDGTGKISNITLTLEIYPKEKQTINETINITVDLNKPGQDIITEITKIMPNLRILIDKNDINKPVTFDFTLKPKEGTEDEINTNKESILRILKNILPKNRIGVTTTVTREPTTGKIKDVKFKFTINPKQEDEVDIDLTGNQDNSILKYIINILPLIRSKVEKDRLKGKPVIIDIHVQPNKGSNDQTVDMMVDEVLTTITKLYPDDKVIIKPRITKNPKGNVTNIKLTLTLELKPKIPRDKNIYMRIEKPTKLKLKEELTRFIPNIRNTLTEKESKNEPLVFKLNIESTKIISESFIPETISTITEELTELFPKNEITVTPKICRDLQGKITDITTIVTMLPKTETTVKPDTSRQKITFDFVITNDVIGKITEILPDIKDKVDINESKNKPSTFIFNIKPDEKTTETKVKIKTTIILKLIKKLFPNNEVTIKNEIIKDNKGIIIDVISTLIIQPKTTTENPFLENIVTPSTESPPIDDVKPEDQQQLEDDDFILPTTPKIWERGTTQKHVVEDIVTTPKVTTWDHDVTTKKDVFEDIFTTTKGTTKLIEDVYTTPVTTTQKHVIEDIVTTPKVTSWDHDVTTKKDVYEDIFTTTKGTTTQIEDVYTTPVWDLGVTTTQKHVIEDIVTTPKVTTWEQDVTTTTTEIDIFKDIFTTTPKTTTQSILDDILTTPKGSQWEQDTTTSKSIIEDIGTPKPDETIHFEDETTATPSKPGIRQVVIDLTKPGTDIETEIINLLPDITKNVERTLIHHNKNIKITFNIKLPKGTKETFLQDTTKKIMIIISKRFPNNEIKITTNGQKDSNNNLTTSVFNIIVSPNKEQKEGDIYIDLTSTGITITDQITIELPKVLPKIKDDLNKGKTYDLNFVIKPPKGSKDSFIQETIQNILPSLTVYFPNNEIKVTTTAQKDSNGNIITMNLVITINPTQRQQPDTATVDIDLSIGGLTIETQVERQLPTIKPKIEEDLNKGKPVTVTFTIKPPKNAKKEYLHQVTQSLIPILTKYFPSNQITVKTSAQQDGNGNLTSMIVTITIQPSDRQKPKERNVDIDLTMNVNVEEEFTNIFTNLLPQITIDLGKGKPLTLNFKLIPPKGKDQSYLNILSKQILPILTRFFPNNKVNIDTSGMKNPDGTLNIVLLEITLQPTVVQKIIEEKFDIDLTKSPSLKIQIETQIKPILENLLKQLHKDKPITLTFNVKPLKYQKKHYLQTVTTLLVPILEKLFPDFSLNIKTSADEDNKGYLITMIFEITIKPKKEKVDIDLTRSGSNLVALFTKLLPTIKINVTPELDKGKPVTIKLIIKPPTNSKQSYLHTLTNSILPLISKQFPSNSVSIKTSAQQDSIGNLTMITLTIIMQPKSTTLVEEPSDQGVDIDLTRIGVTIPGKLNKALPDISNKLKIILDKGDSATLSIKIIPPNKKSDSYLPTITNQITPILTKYFPSNQITIKTSAEKNSNGYLTMIIVTIKIKPTTKIEIIPTDETIEIDLTRIGETIAIKLNELLPDISKKLKEKVEKTKEASISIRVIPYKQRDTYITTLTSLITPYLTRYFPDYVIDIKTAAEKDYDGYLTLVVLTVTIKPTTTVTISTEKVIELDLKIPGISIIGKITGIIKNLIDELKRALSSGKLFNLKFSIIPPIGSTQSFLTIASNAIKPIIQQYLPGYKLNINTSSEKNFLGLLSKAYVTISIEPLGGVITGGGGVVTNGVSIDINLTKSSLLTQLKKLIPTIKSNILSLINSSSTADFKINIIAPKLSKLSYVKTTTNSLVTYLTTVFPKYKMNVKTNANQNSKGYVTDFVIIVTITK